MCFANVYQEKLAFIPDPDPDADPDPDPFLELEPRPPVPSTSSICDMVRVAEMCQYLAYRTHQ